MSCGDGYKTDFVIYAFGNLVIVIILTSPELSPFCLHKSDEMTEGEVEVRPTVDCHSQHSQCVQPLCPIIQYLL